MQTHLDDISDGKRQLVVKDLTLPSSLRILMLGPHPDDFDAIGVTLKHLYDNGNPIHVAVVRSGSGVEDTYCTPPTIERMTEVREAEQRKSCTFFGLPEEQLMFLDLDEDDRDADGCDHAVRRGRGCVEGGAAAVSRFTASA